MKIRVYQMLESVFQWIAERAEDDRQHFAVCPECGQNRYTGEACIK